MMKNRGPGSVGRLPLARVDGAKVRLRFKARLGDELSGGRLR